MKFNQCGFKADHWTDENLFVLDTIYEKTYHRVLMLSVIHEMPDILFKPHCAMVS